MVNPLAAALGPVGGLAACACCFIIAAIWGLFATTIALAVYTSKNLIEIFRLSIRLSCFLGQWRDALRDAYGLSGSGAVQIFVSHALLIGILCAYGYAALRRSMRAV